MCYSPGAARLRLRLRLRLRWGLILHTRVCAPINDRNTTPAPFHCLQVTNVDRLRRLGLHDGHGHRHGKFLNVHKIRNPVDSLLTSGIGVAIVDSCNYIS